MLLLVGMTLFVALALDARPAHGTAPRGPVPADDPRLPPAWQDGPGPIPWPA